MSNPEVQKQIAVRGALNLTTITPGWRYVQKIKDAVIAAAKEAAIDEVDREKRDYLVIKAKALKDGLGEIFAVIENTKQYSPEEAEPDWFSHLEEDAVSEVE